MKRLKLSLATLLTVFSLVGGLLLPAAQVGATVSIGDVKAETCSQTGGTFNTTSKQCEGQKRGVVQTVQKIINVLLFILGIIAVIVIVIGGVMYATSGGNAEQTKKAKDAILYAIIGIVVAVMAYAIVGFVTQNIK